MRQSCLMTEQLQDIKTLIEQGDTERAIHALTNFIRNDAHVNDEPYYLLGNAYRNYLEAIERNPESPAVSARDMIMNILNFYNKDMYNQ